MKIHHIGLWVSDLEASRRFYEYYFGGKCGERYENVTKGFASYMLSFEDGTALEIMTRIDVSCKAPDGERLGWAHLAFTLGSEQRVNELVEVLRADGYCVDGEPRITGDGYYEAVILDNEGNRIEIVK